ncbi:MAG: T9SS type A sorting domain-containing protein [Bacteroidales bacterium]|nr:T9SS type A sorting domain-containing protein [Bacteroidales bacterium]MCF8338575.1 T9SS type A sorting domain-containing protein [Bacteroidales bacterium]
MKRLFIFIAALALLQVGYSQEFSFTMYFEDASGQHDTLTFGYDAEATDSIDASFGEEDISNTPFSADFEVRISDFNYPDVDLFLPGDAGFQTKTQIKKKECDEENFPLVSAINLSEVNYPLKVYWESSLFTEDCLQQSLVTDWHPGGWFDAAYGGEQGPFYMDSNDTVEFTHTTHQMITANNDTTDVLFFTLASVNNLIAGTGDLKRPAPVSIYPNPTHGSVKLNKQNPGRKIKDINVYDFSGRQYDVKWSQKTLDMHPLKEGLYLVRITLNNRITVSRKILKSDK